MVPRKKNPWGSPDEFHLADLRRGILSLHGGPFCVGEQTRHGTPSQPQPLPSDGRNLVLGSPCVMDFYCRFNFDLDPGDSGCFLDPQAGEGAPILKIRRTLLILLSLTLSLASCRRTPQHPNSPGDVGAGESPAALTEKLKLKPGMRIHLRQFNLAWGDQWIPLAPGVAGQRTLTIVNPSSAEGLSFTWDLKAPDSSSTSPESDLHSQPNAKTAPQFQIKGWEGKMTLANATTSRRLTLPAFWPDGELYLSNASAIWLSDRSFEELKKTRKTEWGPGILNNPLLGPLQGLKLLESGLAKVQAQVEQSPEKQSSANEIKAEKRPTNYSLKINDVAHEVEVLEAGNWLVRYKILNNAQNPLILEVSFLPKASAGEQLFSALTPLKGLLEYQVTEIDLPKP